MLVNVIPQQQKEGEMKGSFIQDPVRAAVITLYVWNQYQLKMDKGELSRVCISLSLPKLPEEDFLQYWTDLSNHVSCLQKWVFGVGLHFRLILGSFRFHSCWSVLTHSVKPRCHNRYCVLCCYSLFSCFSVGF